MAFGARSVGFPATSWSDKMGYVGFIAALLGLGGD